MGVFSKGDEDVFVPKIEEYLKEGLHSDGLSDDERLRFRILVRKKALSIANAEDLGVLRDFQTKRLQSIGQSANNVSEERSHLIEEAFGRVIESLNNYVKILQS